MFLNKADDCIKNNYRKYNPGVDKFPEKDCYYTCNKQDIDKRAGELMEKYLEFTYFLFFDKFIELGIEVIMRPLLFDNLKNFYCDISD